MTLTETEIARLAAMTNALRPDWPAASLRTLITDKLANRARRDLAVALAWVACESETKTPARVLEPGPWWRAALIEAPHSMTRQPPRREQECRRHPGEWSDACRPCSAERIAKAEEEPPVDLAPGADVRAVIKAQLAQHNANTCPHHVLPARCGECSRQPKEAPAHLSATTEETA